MSNSLFVTTTIPYVNSKPHVGHAQEFALADAIARFHRQRNRKVILQSGTDDNAFKNVIAAKEAGITPKEFVDQNSKKFERLLDLLNVKTDHFVRTASPGHFKGVIEFLRHLRNEDVYLSPYEGLYCQGCEDFYNERDLIEGRCPDHKTIPQKTNEQNVFFKLSKYQNEIYALIKSDKVKITPSHKKTEILKFIEVGLSDISLSRSAQRSVGWGIPFPGQPDQVVYVWIDALINYLSGLGYGQNLEWKKIWNEETHKIHVIGKNVWKFHAIYWIGLLLSAGLPLPNEIIIHGFLTCDGVKISKSLGNGADPALIIQKYGADAVRFYLLQTLSFDEDSDFVEAHLENSYNSELANKFGNLVSRLLALRSKVPDFHPNLAKSENPFFEDFRTGTKNAFSLIDDVNKEINDLKPWELLKSEDLCPLTIQLKDWLKKLGIISFLLEPVIPLGCEKLDAWLEKSVFSGQLYPRK